MSRTELNVCNRSLTMAGADPIEALDENTPLGAFCQINYVSKRNWLLSRHRWVFASRVGLLSRVADAEVEADVNAAGTFAYVRPSDLIGVIHAFRETPDIEGTPVRVVESGGRYWSRHARLWAEYTAARPEADWPEWFTELVVTAFAVDVARQLQNRSMANDFQTIAFGTPSENGEGGLYATARSEDGRAAPQRQMMGFCDGALVGARYLDGAFFDYGRPISAIDF